jgi:hypothetical protein
LKLLCKTKNDDKKKKKTIKNPKPEPKLLDSTIQKNRETGRKKKKFPPSQFEGNNKKNEKGFRVYKTSQLRCDVGVPSSPPSCCALSPSGWVPENGVPQNALLGQS